MNQLKDIIDYLFNLIKIWVIIQPWETALKVRLGKKIIILKKGIHFKIPYFDSIYKQENRLRIVSMPIQTVTTKDFKTITIDSAIGYSIVDIKKLYETLYHPEMTIINIVMSEVSKVIYSNNLDEISISNIEDEILKKLHILDYGLKFESYKIKTFAVVRTYRIINDQSWTNESLHLDQKV
jgi:regulator of protease activity HflC (stomatin/prohibitin superfamily)